jgi:hypothetical protein
MCYTQKTLGTRLHGRPGLRGMTILLLKWRTPGFEYRLGQEFSLCHVQAGSEAHPAYYTMGTEGAIPGVKRPEREADHSPPTSAEVKKKWIYTYTPHTPLRHSA